MEQKTILIVDDEENMRHMLTAMLSRHGFTIATAADGNEAGRLIADEEFDFILCDVRMPGISGLDFLQKNRDVLEKSTVIMMSAYGSIDLAIECMKKGAYDFISKPFKTDEVILTLRKAEEREQLKRENRLLKNKLMQRGDGFTNIIGESEALQKVLTVAEKVARYDTSVLLLGESGTGKELFARGIHTLSQRGDKPFFAINCGSFPADLIESELFGHMRGSFTGAEKNKKGIFEEANGSTLFLDEIGELPPPMQVKLLRVLQEQEVRRVGDSSLRKIDVRILAATGRDLQREVLEGRFREDLLYRLDVLTLPLPPLRERMDDILLLAHFFIDKYNKKFGTAIQGLSSESKKEMLRYDWPGNVRELENVIQREVVLADTDVIHLENLGDAGTAGYSDGRREDHFTFSGYSIKEATRELESKLIKKALDRNKGNKSRAAIMLEMSYPTLLQKIKEYQL